MIFPVILLVASLASVGVALALPGWSDLIMLGGPCALASILLLLRASLHRPVRAQKTTQNWVVVDGSNVMYWKDGTPRIETVREVVRHISGLGYTPGVVFDANAGYLISGEYKHDGYLGKLLKLPKDRVMVVPKGTPADPAILTAARDLGAVIVTNDRFRDWADEFPEVRNQGYLNRGEYRSGQLVLEMGGDGR